MYRPRKFAHFNRDSTFVSLVCILSYSFAYSFSFSLTLAHSFSFSLQPTEFYCVNKYAWCAFVCNVPCCTPHKCTFVLRCSLLGSYSLPTICLLRFSMSYAAVTTSSYSTLPVHLFYSFLFLFIVFIFVNEM